MNFNLYLDDKIARELDEAALALGRSRSDLIRQVIYEWLDKNASGNPTWSLTIMRWCGIPEFRPFESYRNELL